MTMLTLLLLVATGPARAGVALDELGALGTSGAYHYYGTRTQVSSPLGPTGRYTICARVKTWRLGDLTAGTFEEYSAGLRRELYHTTIAGRLATAPPNTQRAAYHLAQGELLLTWYGLTLGPEHPELSQHIWESTAPVPAGELLDREWVTQFHTVYTNTDHHLQFPTNYLIVVQNSWQFEARETWRKNTSFAILNGHDRYNRVIRSNFPTYLLDNVDYPGNPFGVGGWPNNYVGVDARQTMGEAWTLSASFTRLNLLNNGVDFMYGWQLESRPFQRLAARLGYYYKRRRGTLDRQGLTAGLTYLW